MSQRIFPVVVIAVLMIAALPVNVLAQESKEPVRTGLRPDSPPYGIRGPYPVGTMEFVIEDEERPLPVTVWYPAVNPEEVPETITYSINYPPVFSDLPYQGQAILNAAADTERGPYPLVVFMHGVFRFRLSSTYFTEHLASHGFVVMAAITRGTR